MINIRQLGSSNLFVSEIGLGSMSFQTQTDAEQIIHYAIENGVNFIDTADLYQFGTNEEWIGNALQRKRDKIILATKGGNRWQEDQDSWDWDPSKTHIKQAVKNSLTRLRTDYIDLYQLHGGTIEDNMEETIEAFEELKQEGLIRYYGISSLRPNVIKHYVKHANIVSVMLPYSLLDRRSEELLPLLEKNNISVIARGPLAKGALTNQAKEKTPSNGVLQYTKSDVLKLNEKLSTLNDRSITEMALRFPLDKPTVASVIPGASSLSQLQTNIQAATSPPLTKSERQAIVTWTKEATFENHRN